jgi:ABC-type antimicrobial peptide transport system permease subunit
VIRKDYPTYELKRYDFLSVEFNQEHLLKIRDLKNYLFQTQELSIDMAQVEAKENYAFVTKLTIYISISLLVFSVISITLFLSNVLRNHLEKIKMNIGTFKAFGMETSLLKKIYLSICGLFIALSITISLLLSWILGDLIGIRLGLIIKVLNLEPNQSYFELLNYKTPLAILLIFVISLIVMNWTMNKIFRCNPGDLIYDRNRE